MKPSSTYTRAFTWLQRTLTQESTYGHEKESWTSNGTVWGLLVESASEVVEEFGVPTTHTYGSIRLRQFPQVKTEDRLQCHQFGDTFFVTGVQRDFGANETILTVHRKRLPS